MQCNNTYPRYYEYEVYSTKEPYWLETDYNSNNQSGEHCLFRRREPSMVVFAVYAFVVPSLSLFGLCANFINAIVFMRPKMTPSAFTYLAALSWLDCLSCLFITLTAFSRSIFFRSTFWLTYDLQWQTPLFGITTGAANLILACVSLDRLVYLWRGIPNGTPRLCRRTVARRMIIGVICISFAVNFPYFFVFVVYKDGTFAATEFYYSQYYKIHNWFSFILLAILPAVFLLIGNAAILIAFRRWTKQSKKCQKQCNTNGKTTEKRYQHQMKLTITILIVITLYLIGELPAHLTSRKSALNLLYSGDVSKVDFRVMERLEIICITLNAVQLSMNIMVYALINPSFMPEFFTCLRGASDYCFRFFCFTAAIRYFRQRFQKDKQCDNEVVIQKESSSASWSDDEPIENSRANQNRKQFTEMNDSMTFKTNRSKSLENFAFDNHAMDRDYLDENRNVRTSALKRHSMPPIYLKAKFEIVH